MLTATTSPRTFRRSAAAVAGVVALLGVTQLGASAGADPASPQAVPAPGSIPSCTEHFGLDRPEGSNSNLYNWDLVRFDVRTSGPVTPAPVIGGNLVPVVTVKGDDGTSVECIPEPGWTDEASFATFLGVDFGLQYPGPGYYVVPATPSVTFDTADGSFTAVGSTIRFETDLSGVSVSWNPVAPPSLARGWVPIAGDFPLPADDPGVLATVANVQAAGDSDQAALVEQILVEHSCDEGPTLDALAATLGELLGEEGRVTQDCFAVADATQVYYLRVFFPIQVADATMVVTVAAASPTTTAPPAAPAETAPAFTG